MSKFPALAVAGLAILVNSAAFAQTTLPAITLDAQKPHRASPKAKARPHPSNRVAARNTHIPHAGPSGSTAAASGSSAGVAGTAPGEAASAAPSPAAQGEAKAAAFRDRVSPKAAASATTLDRAAIARLPAGPSTTFDQTLYHLPGVSQDSAASGDFHIRNEHANVQYRINGILIPDGVSGFAQVLDTNFVRSLTLLNGALPAQYGLHTAGIVDIVSRNGADDPGTTVDVSGGSFKTITTSIDTSGASEGWDYFLTGRFSSNGLGIENPQASHDALHDDMRQGRYFAYVARDLEDGSRLTFMSGASSSAYQIPNTPAVDPSFKAFGLKDYDSATLNENQVEQSIFNVLAWQKSIGNVDTQTSYFQRYSRLHFLPDPVGDLLFNGVASDVTRTSLVNGLQNDNALRTSARNTVRFGFVGEVERAEALNTNLLLPTTQGGRSIDAPFTLSDAEAKTGLTAGLYVSDEYALSDRLSLTAGLRYDAIQQYVSADQLSPRLGVVFKATPDTTFHAGYARTFTPPELALAGASPLGLYDRTTLEPDVQKADPVRPERAHVFDVGVTHRLLPSLEIGLDAYYKIAKNLLDDGQFGQALVLTAFNYDHAYNDGVEFKANYHRGDFAAYGNVAVAQQRATQVTSNQYLFDPDELAYIANHYVYTDHDQLITASAGASYRILQTLVSADLIYGSGLRDDFANTGTVPPHAVVNLGLAWDIALVPKLKPATLRFTVANLFDNAYQIRDGSGIGVFAAQYGARRGFFAGLSQRF